MPLAQLSSWVALLLLAAPVAGAPPERKRACIYSHAAVQRDLQRGMLTKAREEALKCMKLDCPAVLRTECEGWLKKTNQRIVRVVFDVRNAAGKALFRVAVHDGGKLLSTAIDGTGMRLDPGLHAFRFTAPWGAERSVTVPVHEGAGSQMVRVQFGEQPTKPPSPVTPRRMPARAERAKQDGPRSVFGWSFFAGGASALSVAGYFGMLGLSTQRELETSCAPGCRPDDLAPMRAQYLAADVALGVGVIGLVSGVYLLLSGGDAAEQVRFGGAGSKLGPFGERSGRPRSRGHDERAALIQFAF